MRWIGSKCRALCTRMLDKLDDKVSARAAESARLRGHTVTRIPGTRTHSYRDDARWDRIRELQEFIDAEEAAIEEIEDEGWDEDGWEDEVPTEDVPAEVGGELGVDDDTDAPDAGDAAPEFPQPVPWQGGAR